MQDVLIGLLAVAVGLLLCFRGYTALRVVIALWGAFVGFLFGAGLAAAVTDEGLLGSALSWIVAIVVAVLFGMVAYLFYAVSVVIGMAAIGFVLGTTLMAALGVRWSWVVVLVGLVAGGLLALLAIAGDLPLLILAILGALAGASVTVTGLLLLAGALDGTDLGTPETTEALELGWVWPVVYVALAVAGLVVQLRSAEARRGTLRDAWSA